MEISDIENLLDIGPIMRVRDVFLSMEKIKLIGIII